MGLTNVSGCAQPYCPGISPLFYVILEGNVIQIVNTIKAKGKTWSKFGHVVGGIKDGMLHLQLRRIDHVNRDTNSVAHSLARGTINDVMNKIQLEEISNCVYRI